ncbi:hypothetical protein [Cupriavidus nantongensis]|uniref:hypothetical protein n=1 Tax=Cupriavidus nantongensis TaxID=1796606 RepID=UPI002247ECCB|nr:hypothetical protein [Cupriavidus nantongensis]
MAGDRLPGSAGAGVAIDRATVAHRSRGVPGGVSGAFQCKRPAHSSHSSRSSRSSRSSHSSHSSLQTMHRRRRSPNLDPTPVQALLAPAGFNPINQNAAAQRRPHGTRDKGKTAWNSMHRYRQW